MTRDEEAEDGLSRLLSPYVLKLITDNTKYRSNYKSYAFGLVGRLRGKWIWIVFVVIIVAVILLYLSGNLNFMTG